MKLHLLFGFCVALFLSGEVRADGENEIKRGTYPFMALIYYSDATIVDATGARFQRGGVLIKLDWIVSAAIDHRVTIGFPHKTLLARLGATTLDGNFTLNEDMDEQEREVIQIVRPSGHHVAQWWITDITLLKTVHPFISTAAVAPITVNTDPIGSNVTNCKILIFSKKLTSPANEKVLMQMTVELLPPMVNNCGSQFNASSMICAFDSEETKNIPFHSDFCVGNAGGPLICEDEVVGLQTYIENNCKVPYLYQLLSPWEKFISCGTQEQCHVDETCLICTPSFKDLQRGGDKVAHPHENLRKSQASESPLSDLTNTNEDETASATLLAVDTQGQTNATPEATQTDENTEDKTDTETSSESKPNPETTASSLETSSMLPSSETATRTTKNGETTTVEDGMVSEKEMKPSSLQQGEESQEQATSTLKVEIAAQQQPTNPPVELVIEPKKRSNNAQNLTKSNYIVMLLLVSTGLMN